MNTPGFFEKLESVRDVLNNPGPASKRLEVLLPLLEDQDLRKRFFIELKDPEWVCPLREEGFFRAPPEPMVEDAGTTYPFWPPSQYLARMASAAPEEVFKALEPIETTNARIISDVVEAALGVPGVLASRLSSKVLRAVNADVWVELYAESAAKLVAKLAADGELDAAFTLAGALFSFRCDESAIRSLVPRIDAYHYGELLPDVLQALCAAVHTRAMSWGAELLLTAVRCRQRPPSREDFDDVSYIWRPAIEDHEQNRHPDVGDAIVTAVRDLSEQVVRKDLWSLRQTVEYLEDYSKLILSRIGLNVVRLCAEKDPELARQRMLDKELFDDHRFRHEYVVLLQDRFGMLSPGDQLVILGWIDEGLDRDETRKSLQANLGDRFSEEMVERRIQMWRRDRLGWFSGSLAPEWKQRYENLVQEFGEPEHPDLLVYTGVGWGAEPPKKAEELAAMRTGDLVNFLRTWRPGPGDPMGPKIRELADQLGVAVSQNLERFAREAPEFSDLHPTYVSRFLNEYMIAVQNERDVPFEPLLNLCLEVVAKPLELASEHRVGGDEFDSDQSWEYARNAVADLVAKMCEAGAPLTLRKKLWQCLAPLEESPDSSYVVDDPKGGMETAVWLTHACNNPRAKVIEAVIRYAIWVKRQATEDGAKFAGLNEVPEAKAVLEKRLAPDCPDSPAVRSGYGTQFPRLWWLDAAWAREHAKNIFSLTGEKRRHGWAAWNSYLVANRVYEAVFHTLREVYEEAVDQLNEGLTGEGQHFNPLHNLAEHMVVLCGRGALPIDDEDGLLQRFFHNSAPAIRAHAIESVGTSLRGAEKLPEGIISRFVSLWKWYWSEFGAGRPDAPPEQFAGFGSWLACGKFEDEWCLNALADVVEVAPIIEPHQDVMEKLAELVESYPEQVVHLVDRMVRADQMGWQVISCKVELKSILGAALSSGGDAKHKAERVIDYLGRRGGLEFGELLKTNQAHDG